MKKTGTHISIPLQLDIQLDLELKRLDKIFPKNKDLLMKTIYDNLSNKKYVYIFTELLLYKDIFIAAYKKNGFNDYEFTNLEDSYLYDNLLIYINSINDNKIFISGTKRLYTYNNFDKNELIRRLSIYFKIPECFRERILYENIINFYENFNKEIYSYSDIIYAYQINDSKKYNLYDYYPDKSELRIKMKQFLNFVNKYNQFKNLDVYYLENINLFYKYKDTICIYINSYINKNNHTIYILCDLNKKLYELNVKEFSTCEADTTYDGFENIIDEFIYGLKKANIKLRKKKENSVEFSYGDLDKIKECIIYFKDYIRLEVKPNNKYIVYGNNRDINNFFKLLGIEQIASE